MPAMSVRRARRDASGPGKPGPYNAGSSCRAISRDWPRAASETGPARGVRPSVGARS